MTITSPPPPATDKFPAVDRFAENFHDAFLYFARAQNLDDKVQSNEFEHRFQEKLDFYRQNDSKFNDSYDLSRVGKKTINFNEFGVLRKEFGLPFANKELGYYLKDRKDGADYGGCGVTSQSDVNWLEGELSLGTVVQRLNQQIAQYTGEDVSKGVSEGVLHAYYDRRNKEGLAKPNFTTNYWFSPDWSSPYDVGAKNPMSRCPPPPMHP